MPDRRARRTLIAVAVATGTLGAGAAASASTVTVPADDGSPLVLAPGAPPTISALTPTVGISATNRYTATIQGPDGTPLAGTVCNGPFQRSFFPGYGGNGTYSVTVVEYSDTGCTVAVGGQQVQYTVAAGASLQPRRGLFLMRAPRSVAGRTLPLRVNQNPGGGSTEVLYRINGRLRPDGGLIGVTRRAIVDRERGIARLTFPVPGVYTVVARTVSGSAATPWSAPVRVRTVAPFDLSSVTFPDSRGPSYLLRGRLRHTFATGGRVRIAVAPGVRGRNFRSLGVVRVSGAGTFVRRFTLRTPGVYRLRYTFFGTPRVLRGQVTQRITIRRTFL